MKAFALPVLALTLLVSFSAQAKTITSSKVTLAPSTVDQIVKLVDKKSQDSSHTTVSIVVKSYGMSTDVSPRYAIYLGYANLAEMGNIYADFEINTRVLEFISATRKSAGIYEIKFVELTDDGADEVTQTIDSTQMFIDKNKMLQECGGDFCDGALNTSVSIKETSRTAKWK